MSAREHTRNYCQRCQYDQSAVFATDDGSITCSLPSHVSNITFGSPRGGARNFTSAGCTQHVAKNVQLRYLMPNVLNVNRTPRRKPNVLSRYSSFILIVHKKIK